MINPQLNAVIDILLAAGETALVEKLRELAEENDGLTKALLSIAVGYVEANGAAGLQLLKETIYDIIDGEDVPLDTTDLVAASNLLAALQMKELEDKNALKNFVSQVTDVVAALGIAVFKAAF